MVSAILREFLESSTIHGLVHISKTKSHIVRFVWVIIVVTCFAFAYHMISSSFDDLKKSPVSTTITTHPITELEFPPVTVCPPRGSNTVLNHLLEKVKSANFSEKEKQELLEISREVFLENPNQEYAKPMVEMLGIDNTSQVVKTTKQLCHLFCILPVRDLKKDFI